jgi:molecular chaperone DnaK (HSP70)
MAGKRVYGIDLGTTYSCIAYVDDNGKPVVIRNSDGMTTTPSVVHFESPTSIVVGKYAKTSAKVSPADVVQMVKRDMGNPNFLKTKHGKEYQPQAISALILRKLCDDVEKFNGDKVEDVVITCPAYFGMVEKAATKEAGVLAGLNVRFIAPEPTAAAFAHGMEGKEGQIILVYDLGGGTFDITLLRMPGEALATGGSKELGGGNWDDELVSLLCRQFEEKTGVPIRQLQDDPVMLQELVEKAEECKFALTSKEAFKTQVRFGVDAASVEITRAAFEAATSHHLDRTIEMTRELLGRESATGVAIDTMLLVGGSTFMPQVEARLRKEFPSFKFLRNDPNEIVAKGAALLGLKFQMQDEIDRLMAGGASRQEATAAFARETGMTLKAAEQMRDTDIKPISAKSFGLMVINASEREFVQNLLVVDDPLPATVTRFFSTHGDQQTSVLLRVMENNYRGGEDEEVPLSDGTQVGEATLKFNLPLPRNSPIEVTYSLSIDGILQIYGRELATGTAVQAKFVTDALNTSEELARRGKEIQGLQVG